MVRNQWGSGFLKQVSRLAYVFHFEGLADSEHLQLCAAHSAKAAEDDMQINRHHSVPIKCYFKNRSPGATDPPI